MFSFLLQGAAALHTNASYFRNESRPLVLGHRGAPGSYPEHSSASYEAAHIQGADFVELDLQLTKDGHLICSHDPTLNEVSNIEDHASEYEDRRGTWNFPYPYDYHLKNEFLINDFTLAEIKTLKKVERYSYRNSAMNGLFDYMTLEETIDLMLNLNANKPQLKAKTWPTGLYIETKMFEFYKGRGQDIAEATFKVLQKYGLETVEKSEGKIPIIMECFEEGGLRRMGELTDLPLVFLLKENVADHLIPKLPHMAKFSHAIGPRDALVKNKLFVDGARLEGLDIHPWYVKDDMLDRTHSPFDENMLYYSGKFQGIFTEFPHMTLTVFENA